MKLGFAGIVAGVFLGSLVGTVPAVRAVETRKPAQVGISAEASAAMQRMDKTLSANDLSFQARTIRVYLDDQGQPLHIFHTIKIAAHRPNRLAVQAVGDDGENDLFYEGKTVALTAFGGKKYVKVAAPDNIQDMMNDASKRLHVDFPLADLLDSAPGASVLSGVTSGRKVGTSIIDGKSHDHLVFSQTGGIELEVWLDKTDKALLRRLIVTYRALDGQPSFVAEFSDWNFSPRPESAFAFQPSAGAKQIQVSEAALTGPANRRNN
jgi:hypothetical protein